MKGRKLCCGLLLALFIMLGLSLSVFSVDSSAVSLTQTYPQNSSVTRYDPIFPDCTDYNCLSQFSYLKVENNNLLGFNLNIKDSTGARSFAVPSYFPVVIYQISTWSSIESYLRFNSNDTFSYGSVTFTLLDSLESSCPEIEPCPVIPEYPYKDDLASIKNSILLCGGAILVIYFFYAIYKMILGGL